MDRLWGWLGSQFLALYPVWFFSTLILTFVVQGLLTRVGPRPGAQDPRSEVWQGAFVAGGYRRVADTAIAALAVRGGVRVSGVLALAEGAIPDGPIETAVCTALRTARPYRTVLRLLRHDPATLAVEGQARGRGLMLGGARAVWWYLVMLPFSAVAAVGLVRTVAGADLDRPVDSLVPLLVISGIVLAVLGFRLRVRHRPSPAGRAVVRRLLRIYESRPAPAGATVSGVAALGFRAIHDRNLRWALQRSAGIPRTGDGD